MEKEKQINVIRVSFKLNDKSTTHENLREKATRTCKGKIIASNTYCTKKRFKFNDPHVHLRKLENE